MLVSYSIREIAENHDVVIHSRINLITRFTYVHFYLGVAHWNILRAKTSSRLSLLKGTKKHTNYHPIAHISCNPVFESF